MEAPRLPQYFVFTRRDQVIHKNETASVIAEHRSFFQFACIFVINEAFCLAPILVILSGSNQILLPVLSGLILFCNLRNPNRIIVLLARRRRILACRKRCRRIVHGLLRLLLKSVYQKHDFRNQRHQAKPDHADDKVFAGKRKLSLLLIVLHLLFLHTFVIILHSRSRSISIKRSGWQPTHNRF